MDFFDKGKRMGVRETDRDREKERDRQTDRESQNYAYAIFDLLLA